MKNIVITGGSTGIGSELVKLFSHHCSWQVTTCSRNEEKNRLIGSTLECVNAITVDLGDKESREKFIQDNIASLDSLEAIVCNAAITGIETVDGKPYTGEYLREVNVVANKEIIETLLPKLRNSKGVMLFISSGLANEEERDPAVEIYSRYKKEMEDYLIGLSKRPENSDIKFVIIRPGMVATRLHQNILGLREGKLFERHKKAIENRSLRSPYIMAYIIKHYIEHSNEITEVIHAVSDEEYKSFLKA